MRGAERALAENNYTLYIKAEDGKTGLFAIKPYLESVAFAALKDKTEFARIYNGKYFIAWECGADFSADTMPARWVVMHTDYAQLQNGPPLS